MQRRDVPAMGTAKAAGHTREESSTEVDSPAHPCLLHSEIEQVWKQGVWQG